MANSPRRSERPVVSRIARSATILGIGLAIAMTQAVAADNPDSPARVDKIDQSHGADSLGHFLDFTNPYVSAEYTNDSNVLRLDDIQPVENRGDQYLTLAAGFDSELRSGQQLYQLFGEFDSTNYAHHSELDYNGGKGAAIWHWSLNDLTTGTAGYRYTRTLRNFENEIAPRRDIDVRTENRVYATGDRDLLDNWKLGVRADYGIVTYDNTTTLDIDKTTGGLSLGYVSHAGNTLGADLEYVDGSYKYSPKQNYTMYTIGPTLEWKFTVRTQLDAKVGYTHRTDANPAHPPYGAATGRFTFTIADAGRGSLVAVAWRELSTLGDEISEYTLINGVSLEPAWTLSNGMTVRLKGSYENRDFVVVTGSAPDRKDDVGLVSAYLDWPIGRHIKITGGVSRGRRSSTRLYQDYEFFQQQLQIVGTL
jgi:hypothetical protein